MSSIRYVEMVDQRYDDVVVGMMNALYAEDSETEPRDRSRFGETLRMMRAEAGRGRVMLFLGEGDEVHGYAIVVPMWSNEMGGNVAFVDELYVMPGSRRRGIARGLFEFVERERLFGAVAVALEVSPGNEGAWKLYDSVGFERRPFTTMVKKL